MGARFPGAAEIELPQTVPELAGAAIIASGSGCRLRQIGDDPAAHLACMVANKGGRSGAVFTSHRRRFESINLSLGEIRAICRANKIKQAIF